MRCVGAAAFSILMALTGVARADLVVNISKAQQKLSVTLDGEEAYRWPVSTGRKGYATPSGTFRPERLERHWYSHKYENAPMPWAMFFHRGYAVHGTMEAYNLGRAASHGCVRLRPDHAATLFSLMRQEGARHTRIVVSDKPLPPLRHAPEKVPVAGGVKETPDVAHAAGVPAGPRGRSETLHARTRLTHHAYEALARAEPAPVRHLHRRTASREEAWVRRDTEAWLRSLDRKYGIVR